MNTTNTTQFTIKLFNDPVDKMLPIHYKTIEYFEEFIMENILTKYKIIINSKWIHSFGIFLTYKNHNNIPEHIKRFDGIKKHLVILPPNTFSKELTKNYYVEFYITKIRENSKGEFIGFCEMILDFIETYFVLNYKKIDEHDFQNIRKKVDWIYLKSIKYPAKLIDQRIE